MITINNLREKNKDKLLRLNAYETQGKSNLKMLIFDVDLTHIHETIPMIDCPIATDLEHRSVHALWCGSVAKTISPNIELYSMHYTSGFESVVDWCIENNVRVINSSFSCSYRREKDLAIKKYAEWGGIWCSASGNDGDEYEIDFPASSKYTIATSATNSEDNNTPEVDITTDSYWSVPQLKPRYATFNGTSCATPVSSAIASEYLYNNPTGDLWSFRKWLLVNSINDLDELPVELVSSKLENGERYFVYPNDLKDRLLPVEIKLQIGNKTMLVNGVGKQLRVAPFLKKYSDEFSATCTEIRPIFEEVGNVEWDKEADTVNIKI